jgi:cell division protein FtsB
MPALAQPSIDSLEAAVTSLTNQLTQIKAESEVLKRRVETSEAENAVLKQQVAGGILTDAQVAQVQKITEAILGKSQGPSAS